MPDATEPGLFRSLRFKYGAGLVVFLTVAGFLLWEEHEAHILGFLPLLLLVGVCLGMHLFMHGGHGGHGSDKGSHGRGSGESGA